MTGPKLIEVALPLPEINDASSYDKMPGIGPHPKGIHHWWARLPLPVARAVLFASVVDDPSAHPERFPTEEAQAAERERLFGIIRRLMQKQIHKHQELYAEARAEMLKYCEGTLPPVLDPFAGGGSIPLEAARLGFEAHAGDLNPIAVLLNKCNLELVPRWAGWPPVNPQDRPFLRAQSPSSLGARTSRPQGVYTSHPPAAQTPLPPDSPEHAPHLPHVVPVDAEASSPPHAHASESQPAGRPHKFWHSRGYLPHLDQPGLIQAITFRLHDAVPAEVVAAWKAELGLASGETASADRAAALRRRLAQYEDAGHGACWLRDQRLASLVEDALLHFDGQRYRLLAWCIMPNHVHVLIETRHGWPVPDVVHSWKSFTAKQANRLLQREGPFWMPDYYDRYIRDDRHLAAAIAYIENNPVKAGLVERPEEWRFSSAHARRAGGSGASIGEAVSLSGEQPSGAAGAGRGEPGASETLAIPAMTTSPQWQGAAGLAADVRYYGKVILERARQKIGHLYPTVTVTAEMAEGRPDLRPYVGKELPVIAWIWARTVASPNPALRGLHVPLMSTFWLSSQKGKEAWLEPVVEWVGVPGNPSSSPGVRGSRDDGAVGHGSQSGQDDRAGQSGQDDRAPRSDEPVGASPTTHSNPSGNAGVPPAAAAVAAAAGSSDLPGNAAVPPATPGNLPRWRFAVRTGPPADRAAVRAGTKTGRATFRCLLSGDAITDDYIKAEGQAGRLGMRLVAIVAEGTRGKVYLPAVPEHEQIARQAEPEWKPTDPLVHDSRNIWCVGYGLRDMASLFTPRQLVALTTLSDLVREVRDDVRRDALAAGLSPQDAEAYMATVVTFLALALDRCADTSNALCRWDHRGKAERITNLFSRQAMPMVWDCAEANILGEKSVCWLSNCKVVGKALETVHGVKGYARLIDAARSWDSLQNMLISTDPPYYDNIGYAALSDFFYVWLRRTIGDLYPDLFATILVPKEPELVAAPERFDGDRQRAKEHFETGFRQAFTTLREKMDPRFPLTVYYAFKQDDEESGADEEANTGNGAVIDRTTGWETMLEAMIGTGFQITATWPVRCAQKWRQNAMGTNTLASYIVLACRPRPEDAPQTDRRSFIAALKRELPAALRHLQQGNIVPVDFAQAAIGPGMAIFSRYSRVVEASGRPMTVRTALALINQTLTEVLTEQEDEFDNDTRWAIAWFEQHGFAEGDFGEAELLSKAKATSVSGMVEAGIARSRAGKVRLLRPEELPEDWDPERDGRLTVWEMTHHLLRVYYHEKKGEAATAELLRKLGSRGELARELAYRLFDISERKKRSQEAQAYNALVLGWPEIARLAREGDAGAQQAQFLADLEG